MSSQTLLLLNPASAAGATGRRARTLVASVERVCGPVDVHTTQGPGAATQVAREAAERGVARILIGGGDGTIGEVVSGLLEADVREQPVIGLLPLGSGLDFARSLGLPRRLEAALETIAEGATRSVDVGRVAYRDADGVSCRRYFANEASAGLSGATVAIVGPLSKRLGPRFGFVLGAVGAILTHRPIDAAIEIDGVRIQDGPLSMIVAANGCYFGAGMRVAPRACLDDGLLEIVLVRGLALPRLLVNLPRFYFGRHEGHPNVSFHRARKVAVMPKEGSAPIDVDGESVGGLPMVAEILPAALRVFVPKASSGRPDAGRTRA